MGYSYNNLGSNGTATLVESGLSFLKSDTGQSVLQVAKSLKSGSESIDAKTVSSLLGSSLGAVGLASNPAKWVALGTTAIMGATKLAKNYLGKVSTAYQKFEKVDSLGEVLANTKLYTYPKKITKSIGDLAKGQMVKVYAISGRSNKSWAFVGVGELFGYVKYSKLDLVGSDYSSLIDKISPQLLDLFVKRSCAYRGGRTPCYTLSLPKTTLVADFPNRLLPAGVDPQYTAKFEDSKSGELWYWELDPNTSKTKSSDVVGFKDGLVEDNIDSDTDRQSRSSNQSGNTEAGKYMDSGPISMDKTLEAAFKSPGQIPPALLWIGGAAVAWSLLGGLAKR